MHLIPEPGKSQFALTTEICLLIEFAGRGANRLPSPSHPPPILPRFRQQLIPFQLHAMPPCRYEKRPIRRGLVSAVVSSSDGLGSKSSNINIIGICANVCSRIRHAWDTGQMRTTNSLGGTGTRGRGTEKTSLSLVGTRTVK